jgi:hypothetical protein
MACVTYHAGSPSLASSMATCQLLPAQSLHMQPYMQVMQVQIVQAMITVC